MTRGGGKIPTRGPLTLESATLAIQLPGRPRKYQD